MRPENKKIKVLWFANTACGAASRLGMVAHSGGWLLGLEQALRKSMEIELHVSFYYHEKKTAFTLDGITYHPVLRSERRLIKLLRRLNPFLGEKKEVRALLDVAKSVNPDIIHVHGTEDNFGLVAPMLKIPLVISIQGILSEVRAHFFGRFDPAELAKKESLKSRLLLKTFAMQLRGVVQRSEREKKMLRTARFLIGRTAWDRQITSSMAPQTKYFHCDEILRQQFYWSGNFLPAPAQKREFRIITTLNNTLYKGFDVVLRAASNLGDHIALRWHIVGAGENDSVVKLTQELTGIKSHALNIVFHGKKSAEELCTLLKECHLFCQTSYIENSSNSLCEAMCLGLPVLASNCGGTSTLLQKGTLGLLYAPGDINSLCDNIRYIYANYEEALERAAMARPVSLERHDPRRVGHETISIYKQVISHSKSSADA